MSKPHVLPGQLAIDFDAPPPPPVRPQPPKRPTFIEIHEQRVRAERVAKAVAAKLAAVPKPARRAWKPDTFEDRTRIDRMISDLPGFAVIGRWPRSPDLDQEWGAMREHDVPHGACFYERCSKTRDFVLIADMKAQGHWEERLDA